MKTRKDKNLFSPILTGLLVFSFVTTEASASCYSKAKDRLTRHTKRDIILGASSLMEASGQYLVMGNAYNENKIAKAKTAGNLALGTLIGTTTFIVMSRLVSRPARLVRFLNQVESCKGHGIHRLYLRYAKESSKPVSQESFCEILENLDAREVLCQHSLPTKREMIDTVEDEIQEGHTP